MKKKNTTPQDGLVTYAKQDMIRIIVVCTALNANGIYVIIASLMSIIKNSYERIDIIKIFNYYIICDLSVKITLSFSSLVNFIISISDFSSSLALINDSISFLN
jgi:hypothetical protein